MGHDSQTFLDGTYCSITVPQSLAQSRKGEEFMPPVVVRRKKALVETKKEETPKQSPPKKETAAATKKVLIPEPSKKKPEPKQPDKPQGPPPVDKAQQHANYLSEIEALSSPERALVSACYFLCFLFNENPTTTTLFPMKDKVLEKIFQSGHDCSVSYIRRWDKLTYRLEPEARDKWQSETGAKKDLLHLYRTPGCQVQLQRGYYDLYQFHVVIEPFRFVFYMPVELASWIDPERLQKPRLHMNQIKEVGLLRGRHIKMSQKSTQLTDEQIGAEIQRFLDTEMSR